MMCLLRTTDFQHHFPYHCTHQDVEDSYGDHFHLVQSSLYPELLSKEFSALQNNCLLVTETI